MPHHHALAPSSAQLEQFVVDGFVRVDDAFSADVADACRDILWRACGLREDLPQHWTQPVIRIGEIPHPLFREAANTPRLHAAYDALVGVDGWVPRQSVGTFPIRFPSDDDPGDCGWHVDMSFGHDVTSDFMLWRINAVSRGRALLMLFLFSDVDVDDAPTRLRAGSHLDIARELAVAGDNGLTLKDLVDTGFGGSASRPERLATGRRGTVYLCHPFLVHSAQPLRRGRPRFMGQPALLPARPLDPHRADASPVERAIALGLTASSKNTT